MFMTIAFSIMCLGVAAFCLWHAERLRIEVAGLRALAHEFTRCEPKNDLGIPVPGYQWVRIEGLSPDNVESHKGQYFVPGMARQTDGQTIPIIVPFTKDNLHSSRTSHQIAKRLLLTVGSWVQVPVLNSWQKPTMPRLIVPGTLRPLDSAIKDVYGMGK